MGDPHDPEALGCWASAVQTGLSRFLAAKSRDGAGTYRVKNETGAELGYLCRRYIDRDLPVLLWVRWKAPSTKGISCASKLWPG